MNYNEMIIAIGNLSHEKFLEIYQAENNGTRIKTTKDEEWIEKHGTDQADVAKLDYFELPSEWQYERWAGAKAALDFLLKEINLGKPIDEKFIEDASVFIHDEWVRRNPDRAKKENLISYDSLSEILKEKDRIFARAAVEIYQKDR